MPFLKTATVITDSISTQTAQNRQQPFTNTTSRHKSLFRLTSISSSYHDQFTFGDLTITLGAFPDTIHVHPFTEYIFDYGRRKQVW